MRHDNFWAAITHALSLFDSEQKIHTQRWQGVDISNNPAAAMHEVLHHSFQVPLPTEDLEHYRQDIKPNLPWADNHFLERVCGEPLNPGVEHANWPYAFKGKEAMEQGQYNHNYMERYWPRYAGHTSDGSLAKKVRLKEIEGRYQKIVDLPIRQGIRHEYGDLGNLVSLLAKEPSTRQAYLPVWFPEDTGDVHDGRKPCTLGYHFIMRDGKLDVTYYIRSCDFFRHLQDDIYLTVRLLLWVLDQVRSKNPEAWSVVVPGAFNMHITSLHLFVGDLKVIHKKLGV